VKHQSEFERLNMKFPPICFVVRYIVGPTPKQDGRYVIADCICHTSLQGKL